MTDLGPRQDRAYRRGLVLGLTIAEIMILVVFALLLALTASLSARDEKIAKLEKVVEKDSITTRLSEVLQKQYPTAVTFDDYFKELQKAFDAAEQIKAITREGMDPKTLLENAKIGENLREAAKAASMPIEQYAKKLLAKVAVADKSGDWPPFINLSEANGYFFESGSAELQPQFQKALQTTTISTLKAIIEHYDVDVVEVIGHTDEVPMKGTTNLDSSLIPASRGMKPIASLTSSDNAGLGMARAVSVVKVLRADARLANVSILPFSGAQMIVPIDQLADGTQTSDTPSRRRIEIRVRKSTSETQAKP